MENEPQGMGYGGLRKGTQTLMSDSTTSSQTILLLSTHVECYEGGILFKVSKRLKKFFFKEDSSRHCQRGRATCV